MIVFGWDAGKRRTAQKAAAGAPRARQAVAVGPDDKNGSLPLASDAVRHQRGGRAYRAFFRVPLRGDSTAVRRICGAGSGKPAQERRETL